MCYSRRDWKAIAGAAGMVAAAGAVIWLFAAITGLPGEWAPWVLWVAFGVGALVFEFRRWRRIERLDP